MIWKCLFCAHGLHGHKNHFRHPRIPQVPENRALKKSGLGRSKIVNRPSSIGNDILGGVIPGDPGRMIPFFDDDSPMHPVAANLTPGIRGGD